MNLNQIREDRKSWFLWKNIKPLKEQLEKLEKLDIQKSNWKNENGIIKIDSNWNNIEFAKSLMPWRKGGFQIGDIFIDSEWQSGIKYDILEPHLNITDKNIADIGCNNGYYMFRMLEKSPKKIIGFDPSPLFNLQFQFINRFIQSNIIKYELLGVEHIEYYEEKFDLILCLGVLYHRSDPINTLKQLKKGLNSQGTLILDTFIISGNNEICLFPKDRYAKMKNIYFIPTLITLKNWCKRAGFKNIEIIDIVPTTTKEQRKTEWINGESLNNFLNQDKTKTVEGYPPPTRAYLKLS